MCYKFEAAICSSDTGQRKPCSLVSGINHSYAPRMLTQSVTSVYGRHVALCRGRFLFGARAPRDPYRQPR